MQVKCLHKRTHSAADHPQAHLPLSLPGHVNEKYFQSVFISASKQELGCHPKSEVKMQLIM